MLATVRHFAQQFEAPWVANDVNRLTQSMSLDELVAAGEAIPPGVTARANTSMLIPPQIPDLIGVSELEVSGSHRLDQATKHRRSDALQHARARTCFRPTDTGSVSTAGAGSAARALQRCTALCARHLSVLPEAPCQSEVDALSMPPLSAERIDSVRETCINCHTAPLYTNNKLIPADGFDPPADATDVVDRHIGVDPRYALDSHKGTGYYKVPSLKGVWYRSPLGHTGAAMTLEEWLDPARLNPDYIPTGFKGYDGKARSIFPTIPSASNSLPPKRKDLSQIPANPLALCEIPLILALLGCSCAGAGFLDVIVSRARSRRRHVLEIHPRLAMSGFATAKSAALRPAGQAAHSRANHRCHRTDSLRPASIYRHSQSLRLRADYRWRRAKHDSPGCHDDDPGRRRIRCTDWGQTGRYRTRGLEGF